jgi:diketogulonate reductase-like aldo/keto reductase
MDTSAFGPTRQQVSLIGQGTWYIERQDRPTAIQALQRGFDLGLTHVDTAEMYGSGAAEKIVGEAIAGRRNELFLVSKVLPENASRHGTVAACERSLTRLGTDHLDCYLLHWRSEHPLEDTIAAFEQLRRAGKILSWGVSNFDVPDLEDALDLAGEGQIACNQVLYHVKERAIEHTVIPWCEHHKIAVVAYSPFGHGNFPSPESPGGQVLQGIAAAHGATARQVALRFLVRRHGVVAIPKAGTADHATDNADAGDLRLSDQELARINDAFPLGRPRPELPTL